MSATKEAYIVYRNGKWIEYESKLEVSAELTSQMKWEAAAAYGTAKAKGFSEEKANILAEMYVFKKKFVDLLYSAEWEAEYKKLFY